MDLITGLCVGMMLITAYVVKDIRIRLLVVGLGVLSFALPALWRAPALSTIAFVGRVFIALGCYFYLRSLRKIK